MNKTQLDNYTILVNKYKEYILEMELIIVSKTLTEGYFFCCFGKEVLKVIEEANGKQKKFYLYTFHQ